MQYSKILGRIVLDMNNYKCRYNNKKIENIKNNHIHQNSLNKIVGKIKV